MSFILDALRKSEDRRRIGRAPDLDQGLRVPAQQRRRASWRLPALAFGGLVLLAVGLIAGRALFQSPVSETRPIAVESGIEAALPSAEDTPRTEARATESAPISVDETRARVRDESETSATDAISDAQPAVAVTDAPAPSRAEPEMAQAAADSPEADMEGATVAAVEPAVAEQRDATQPEVREYVYRWELPHGMQRELPALTMSIHVYTEDPAGRFVLVNGERYVEGDRLAPGVRLVSIVREGAVIDFRDHRFLLAQ